MAAKKGRKKQPGCIGRPRKYENPKELGRAIERYFRSISRCVEARDLTGAPLLNDDGEPVEVIDYIRPPSISALCLYLGIDRSTWQNYCDPKLHPEFAQATSRARARIEAYLEEQLLTREKGLQGIIFNLQNNYAWRQRQEVELGEDTRKAAQVSSMSLEEKLAVIAQAAKEYPAGDADDGPGA